MEQSAPKFFEISFPNVNWLNEQCPRSQEKRKSPPKIKYLDVQTDFSNHYHEKYGKNIKEKMQDDHEDKW